MDGWARVKQAMAEGLKLWAGLKQAATATWLKLWAGVQQAATAQWLRFRDSVQQAATATWLKFWARVQQAATATWLRFRDSVQQAATATWLRFWDGLKQEWLRILAGLFMAVVIVASCYWTWSTWHSWRIADLASVTTTWPNSRILKDVLVEIKTKCSDSVLSYDVAIDEFVRIYSSNEERLTSLEAWGTLACSPASYVRAEALIVSWTERP